MLNYIYDVIKNPLNHAVKYVGLNALVTVYTLSTSYRNDYVSIAMYAFLSVQYCHMAYQVASI